MNRPVSGPFGPSGTEAVVKGGNLGEMRHFRKRSHVRAKCWKFDIPDELEQTALMVDQEAATAEGPSAHHGQFAVDLAEPIGLRGPAFKACARDRMGAIRRVAAIKDVHLHDLRHTVGTYAGQSGANAFLVRDLLRHRNLGMTERYVNRADDQ